MEVLKIELKRIDNEILQISIKEQLKEAYKASDDDLAYVEEEFSNFCKNQQLKKALLNSVELLDAGDYTANQANGLVTGVTFASAPAATDKVIFYGVYGTFTSVDFSA